MIRILKYICALLVFALSPPALAQTPAVSPHLQERAEQLGAVIRGEGDAAILFGPQFLAEVSPALFATIIAQVTSQYGAFVGVERIEPEGEFSGTVYLRFETAIVSGPFTLDPSPPHKVAGLILSSFAPVDDSVTKIEADLSALPGKVSVLFTPLDASAQPVLDRNADAQMAIGSTFKLYVLSALARSIANGERQWADVVTLNMRSFPSGTMHLWPRGAPVTLQTLATHMIASSDNTATDVLIDVVGRRAVEAEVLASGHSNPEGLIPLLSTLELFALKGSEANRTKYLAGDERAKRRILADFRDDVGGKPENITPPRFSSPTAIDTIEWFASGHDVAGILRRIVDFKDPTARDILSIYTALPASLEDDWEYTGYKGGSEPGVLNLTWLLRDRSAKWHVLTMSWNNPEAALDHAALEMIAQRIVRVHSSPLR